MVSPGFGRIGLVTPGRNGVVEADEVDGNGDEGDIDEGDINVGGPSGITDVAPGIDGAQTPFGHGLNDVVGTVAGTV